MVKRVAIKEKAIEKIDAILRRKSIIQMSIESKPNKIGADVWQKLLDIVAEATKPEEDDE